MSNAITQLGAVIVGAGFAGSYMLHTARKLGLTATVQKGQGVVSHFAFALGIKPEGSKLGSHPARSDTQAQASA